MVATLRAEEAYGPTNAMVAFSARRVVDARAMLAQVKEMVKETEAEVVDLSSKTAINTVELFDGTLVTRVDADRRKIDAVKLADLATKSVFDSVTESKVVHKKFDAAVELGTVSKALVADVVTTTPYSAIRITKS